MRTLPSDGTRRQHETIQQQQSDQRCQHADDDEVELAPGKTPDAVAGLDPGFALAIPLA
ncbi:MAG: hypothetical protein ABIY40_05795 [Rhodanobacteraceae bacterium]